MSITQERAERIARAHACSGCKEYTWRKVSVKPSSAALRESLLVVWSASLKCGICGNEQELGIDDDGDIVFEG
jgi:hypothetical protein